MLLEVRQPLLQLDLDLFDGALELVLLRHVVRRGEEHQRLDVLDELAGHRIDRHDALDLVAEELHPDPPLLVRGEDLDRVAADPELVADERHVVALVLQLDEPPQDLALIVLFADIEREQLGGVGLRRAEAVDRTDARDDHDVAPAQQGAGGAVAQPVDLVVDRAVLLDVGVARRQVRLGLVVVVVGDEVLHPVVGEELPELRGELGCEALVGRQDQRRPLHLGDQARDGEGLPRSGDPEQGLEALPRVDARGELFDRLGLVPGGGEVGHELELGHRAHPTPGV